jgi:hypothetical protein
VLVGLSLDLRSGIQGLKSRRLSVSHSVVRERRVEMMSQTLASGIQAKRHMSLLSQYITPSTMLLVRRAAAVRKPWTLRSLYAMQTYVGKEGDEEQIQHYLVREERERERERKRKREREKEKERERERERETSGAMDEGLKLARHHFDLSVCSLLRHHFHPSVCLLLPRYGSDHRPRSLHAQARGHLCHHAHLARSHAAASTDG